MKEDPDPNVRHFPSQGCSPALAEQVHKCALLHPFTFLCHKYLMISFEKITALTECEQLILSDENIEVVLSLYFLFSL